MKKVFDFSVTDIRDHTFAFGEMSADEIATKKTLFEAWQKSKAQPPQPAVSGENKPVSDVPKPAAAKPVFRPKIKPPGSNPPST